ncbi:hypothetical protein D3C72_127880 [compost metagenome]
MGKIGLVLCGGVAKGAYEAGVLKALAERQIYPDVIVGISAGAINGAFAAQMISTGQFTASEVERELIYHWRETVDAHHLYHGFGRNDHHPLEQRSLKSLFNRLGIDPLRRQYRPRIGFDSLFAFEQLVRGDFISLINHDFVRGMLDSFLHFPQVIKRDVTLSVVTSDLKGSTTLTDDLKLNTEYSAFDEFRWQAGIDEDGWDTMHSRMQDAILASSSFPFIFPPVESASKNGGDSGFFVDGGLMDSAPIGRAIKLDPEIDTILVVSGSTVVEPPDADPQTFHQVLGRVFSLLAGRFLIQNYHKVLQCNDRILRLDALVKRGKNGNVLHNAYNEDLARLAGFKGLEDYLGRRVVRLIPILPNPGLPGDVFDGFFQPELRAQYIEQGYHDAVTAFGREARISASEPIPSPFQSLV